MSEPVAALTVACDCVLWESLSAFVCREVGFYLFGEAAKPQGFLAPADARTLLAEHLPRMAPDAASPPTFKCFCTLFQQVGRCACI